MKKWIIILTLMVVSGAIILESCNGSGDSINSIDKSTEAEEQAVFKLFSDNCFACHNPDLKAGNRVAPPFHKIREHYLSDGTTQEKFIERITTFIQNPSEENSIMPGAVRHFGMMPKMTFKERDIQQIASYLFKNEVETEKWAEKWKASATQNDNSHEELSYEDRGLKFAMETKAVLGKNLLGAIQTRGTENAVEFCNIQAIPLTDSMSNKFEAKIKRVSDKPRNKNNQANSKELSFIEELKIKNAKGEKLSPKIIEQNDKVLGFYAIETGKMCLQCHGSANVDVQAPTLAKIKSKYPKDKALGYKENEIRGIWVVEMKKNK